MLFRSPFHTMVQIRPETVAVIGLEAARQAAFSDFLRRAGYSVICCKDEDEARVALGGEPPDLVVTRLSAAGTVEEQLLEARSLQRFARLDPKLIDRICPVYVPVGLRT